MPHVMILDTLAGALGVFAVSAVVVWLTGARLAYLADALGDRFNLAKSLVGLLLLSLSTSLPEVATTLSAAVQQSRELVLNNLFGGIALQTAILALADQWARGAITNYPRKPTHALEATMLLFLLAEVLIVIQLQDPWAVGHIGTGSLLIGATYGGVIWLLRRYDQNSDWIPVDLPEPEPERGPALYKTESLSTRALLTQTGLACAAILIFGLGLVVSAESLARISGLGESFVGVTLLAGATSLPELTTSIAAVRIGAYTLAISNIFGSNLIMLVLVLPADLLFLDGPILVGVSETVHLSIAFGIAVTAIYLTGLLVRRKPRIGKLGIDSVAVAIVFVMSLFAYYYYAG